MLSRGPGTVLAPLTWVQPEEMETSALLCPPGQEGGGEGGERLRGAALPPLLTSLGMKCFFADAHLQHRQVLAFPTQCFPQRQH